MKRISAAKRAFLLAVVRGNACRTCKCAPGDEYGPTCGTCMARLIDDQRTARQTPPASCPELCGFDECRAAGRCMG